MRKFDIALMSFGAIRSNKLRSSLTLVGIVLGVASIIGVMTAMDVVQKTMETELSVLGGQTFQLQKWPNGFKSAERRRAAQSWPPVTLDEAQAIRDNVKSIDMVGTELWDYKGKTVSYNGFTTDPKTEICGGSPEYSENNTHYIELGRNISPMDMLTASKVLVMGNALANQLFPFTDPIGKTVRMDGHKYEVIGVFIKKQSAFGGPYETMVLMPSSTFSNMYGMINADGFPRSANITVHARTPELLPDAVEETRQVLRRMRHLKLTDEDNFYSFTSLSTIKDFNKATSGLKIGVFVMGTMSLLVAGIGIMNIMLVAVTERTKEIGIRKSLGAKRRDILWQFLLEAMALCNIGGLLGIALGFSLGNVLSMVTDFEASIPLDWAIYGLLFCSFIGMTFGMIPAMQASKLNPIEALRYE
jgi:putative ABC transport system permease protein